MPRWAWNKAPAEAKREFFELTRQGARGQAASLVVGVSPSCRRPGLSTMSVSFERHGFAPDAVCASGGTAKMNVHIGYHSAHYDEHLSVFGISSGRWPKRAVEARLDWLELTESWTGHRCRNGLRLSPTLLKSDVSSMLPWAQ
jgi:hypothetical protein